MAESVASLLNKMEDGFSKIQMQLEALDEKLADMQNISDKVDMLEARQAFINQWSLNRLEVGLEIDSKVDKKQAKIR